MVKSIVIGASYGGMEAIKTLLGGLPSGFQIPVCIVLHIGNSSINSYLTQLNNKTSFFVKEAEEKETIKPGCVYFAPPNYHLQIENNFTFSLSTDLKVNFSRPSIDVLFETAAWSYKNELIGILLTGANSDGAEGLKTIKKYGGTTIVENPETAFAKTMPVSAIKNEKPSFILELQDISKKIIELAGSKL
jgi:two-component system, chemotaxis family, protein-glutamate methylesterase/glutaminase